MCGSRKAPKVVERDPVQEQSAAEAKAASESNMALAERRRRRRENSLLTLGADGLTGMRGSSLLATAYGKSTLGGA